MDSNIIAVAKCSTDPDHWAEEDLEGTHGMVQLTVPGRYVVTVSATSGQDGRVFLTVRDMTVRHGQLGAYPIDMVLR